MKFVGGCHVFPGGKVEASDRSDRARALIGGRDPDWLLEPFGGETTPAEALGFWLAALRELFEESGVLLAMDESGRAVQEDPSLDLGAFRRDLLAEAVDFYRTVEERGWRLDLGRMAYFDHWITPEYVPMRFDTRFFLARVPEGAEATHWPGEADEGFWIEPGAALRRWEEQTLQMIPPTVFSIRRLLDLPSWTDRFTAR